MMKCTINVIIGLTGWLCWLDGHLMWVVYKVYIVEVVSKYVYVLWSVLGVG